MQIDIGEQRADEREVGVIVVTGDDRYRIPHSTRTVYLDRNVAEHAPGRVAHPPRRRSDARFARCGPRGILDENGVARDERGLEQGEEEQDQQREHERELHGGLSAIGARLHTRAPIANAADHGITLSITASNMRVMA